MPRPPGRPPPVRPPPRPPGRPPGRPVIRAPTQRDIPRILRHLNALQLRAPSTEDADSVAAYFDDPKIVARVDTVQQTECFLHVAATPPFGMFTTPNVAVLWWLPRAAWENNNMQALLPVMAACLDVIIARTPEAVDWILAGSPDGIPAVPQEQSRDKQREILDFWRDDVFGENATGGELNAVQRVEVDGNPVGISTVGTIARLAKSVIVA